MLKIKSYYLDESGSTGDLTNSGTQLDFSDQPIFALSCVGIDDLASLEQEIRHLKKIHRVQGVELKSKALRRKPLFIADLTSYLIQRDLPIMIEVVEKKFFICIAMLDNLIMPAIAPVDLEPKGLWIRNVFVDYIYNNMPNSIIFSYIDACNAKTKQATLSTYELLLSWLSTAHSDNEVASGIKLFSEDSMSDLLRMPERDIGWNGLPIPDDSKSGKPFWMLPNLSSFTNIYARLNQRHQGSISGIKLFHDEQREFGHILENSKHATEKLAESSVVPKIENANYSFSEQAPLSFEKSTTNAGIQTADIIAGFTMRYVQAALFSSAPISETSHDIFQSLIGLSDPLRATGCNFVIPSNHYHRLMRGCYNV